MRRKHQLALLFAAFTAASPLMAEEVEMDTVKSFNIEEAVVVASPKETSFLKQQPLSAMLFGQSDLKALQVKSVKDLSAFAPNFHMPNYGSRLTSAAYIRGVGARMNTPAVGLYVDNVAYTDKTAYDFSFLDVERVDVLRGPQGTLYGRNTMGGLIRVFTADPFSKQGTVLDLSGATHGAGYNAKATTYIHPSDKVALSVGGFYEDRKGFFDNQTTGKEADGLSAGGGKLRAAWKPNSNLRFDLTASYEYSDENACPYYLQDYDKVNFPTLEDKIGMISQNRQSSYRRGLLNTGLAVEWLAPKFILSSVTGYQNLDDRLFMDQDFTNLDVFSLAQQQKMNAFTEEISLKSHRGKRWQWTTGAFFMYQGMTTDCPVTFYKDGVDFVNNNMARVFSGLHAQNPKMPAMGLRITNDRLPFNANMETPTLNAALFHQSTISNLFVDGLSLTLGARLDYDHHQLDFVSDMDEKVNSKFWIFNPMTEKALSPVTVNMNGKLKDDSWQLLPKVALQYDHKSGRGNVYAAVSKGYRSGGYNIQAYSDLSQQLLRRELILAAMSGMPVGPGKTGKPGKPEMPSFIPEKPSLSSLEYKPEESWNYELGGHLSFFKKRLDVDYTFFFMQTKNQQLARFAKSGMGRVMVNAGKSHSCGAELAVRTHLFDHRLLLSTSYGYTYAELKKHNLGSVDYSGNHVPFAPEHTLGAYAQFRQPLQNKVFKAVYCGANVQGAGRMYWDEANKYSQPFYATLAANAGIELIGNVKFEFWGQNLTNTKYDTFSFESMGNRFGQLGTPRHFGMNLSIQF